jgi:uncharacterized membrane protein YfcA
MVYLCCFVLFFAGILCSAGGIGGGGVYVTVLMVAGGLDIVDAVPLSKSIVFSGSLSSLFLNLKKSMSGGGSGGLIDYNICRLVVPGALVGTYVGVLLNNVLPGWSISMVLTLILTFITVLVIRTTYTQYKEEQAKLLEGPEGDQASVPSTSEDQASVPTTSDRSRLGSDRRTSYKEKESTPSMRTYGTKLDACIFLSCLLVVIFFGVFRYHAGRCQHALPDEVETACNHPVMGYFGQGTMEKWMRNDKTAMSASIAAFTIPLLVCFSAISFYTGRLVVLEQWEIKETLLYTGMACSTGILAGLVGIGGGLIFSPFFLCIGIAPPIAVATSSTCVIFTSSSTTLQYLLTDRIVMSLTVIYGVINLVASYVGTKLVHWLQDKYGARKSYISMIVLAGVSASLVLAAIKFVQKLVEGGDSPVGMHRLVYDISD